MHRKSLRPFAPGDLAGKIQAYVADEIADALAWLFVARPAEVTKIYDSPYVDCKLIDAYTENSEQKQFPELEKIPRMVLQGGNFTFFMPIKEGDRGIVLFLDRDPEAMIKGQSVKSDFNLPHALSNGVFLPSYVLDSEYEKSESDGLLIKTSENLDILSEKDVKIESSGKIGLSAKTQTGTVDMWGSVVKNLESITFLLDKLLELPDKIKEIIDAKGYQSAGPGSPVAVFPPAEAIATAKQAALNAQLNAAVTPVKQELEQLKSNIESIKL